MLGYVRATDTTHLGVSIPSAPPKNSGFQNRWLVHELVATMNGWVREPQHGRAYPECSMGLSH